MKFSDLRILDFCWVGAGAFVTRILADLGAEVIKVELHAHPDNLRLSPPHKTGAKHLEASGYFASRNTCKKSIALNMGHPRRAPSPRNSRPSVPSSPITSVPVSWNAGGLATRIFARSIHR